MQDLDNEVIYPFKIQPEDLINNNFEKYVGLEDIYLTDYGDQLMTIPELICLMVGPTLKKLVIYNNAIEFLPPDIQFLSNLTYLNLRDNRLLVLPEEFGALVMLKELFLYNQEESHAENSINYLPMSFSCLTSLEVFNISGNKLSSDGILPLFGCTSLHTLNLAENQIHQLHPSISQLVNLYKIDLSGNGLISIPEEIGSLVNLKILNLQSNFITIIPPSITQCINLSSLNITNNQVERLFLSPSIHEVRAGANQLKELPDNIHLLTSITLLDVSYNQIEEIPDGIGNLTALETLYLCENNIKKLPKSLLNLQKLKSIILYGNVEIPEGMDDPGSLFEYLNSLN